MSKTEHHAAWTGAFTARHLDIEISTDKQCSALDVKQLVGLALRKNPKRAHLLVSTVLAKHVPTPPWRVIAAGALLAELAALELIHADNSTARAEELAKLAGALFNTDPAEHRALDDKLASLRMARPEVVTIGYAETATGLGRMVAGQLGSYYIHSTRHTGDGTAQYSAFQESHSHATDHRILAREPQRLNTARTIVLVDDELSTGATIINTIRSLHASAPQANFVIAALIDVRQQQDRERMDGLAKELGISIASAALGRGQVKLPSDVLQRGMLLVEELQQPSPQQTERSGHAEVRMLQAQLPDLPADRYGDDASRSDAYMLQMKQAAATAAQALPQGSSKVAVVGTEEFIHAPLLLAQSLAEQIDAQVLFSTTTRSPIAAVDREDYAIRNAISFSSHDDTVDGPGVRFAYNLNQEFDAIILIPEPGTDPELLHCPGGVVSALSTLTGQVLVLDLALEEQ